MTLSFDDDDLASQLDALTEAALDALPFGVIGLAPDGNVRIFSKVEAEQSGRGARRTVGLAFFERVAPCMNNEAFRGRIEAARKEGVMDIEFGHTGDFGDASRALRVRAMSARDGGVWLAHQRLR